LEHARQVMVASSARLPAQLVRRGSLARRLRALRGMRMSFPQDLRNRTVVDAAGHAVGVLDSLVIDPESWRVTAIKVKLRREVADQIGAPRTVLRAALLNIPTEHVQAAGGDAVLLRVPITSLRLQPSPPPQPPEVSPSRA
jgi:sporulation protein YlmC with PRC-barrel domain